MTSKGCEGTHKQDEGKHHEIRHDEMVPACGDDSAKGRKQECEEGKIFIESQGFCVMAGVGVETGEAQKALDSAWKYLDTKHAWCW